MKRSAISSTKQQWRFTLPDRPWTLAVTGSELPSEVALLVSSGKANSKAELVRETGLARSTVSSCVDGLLRRGVLTTSGVIAVDRGRPAERLVIDDRLGLIAVADVGARHTMLGIADMNMRLLAHEWHVISIAVCIPEDFLAWVSEQLWRMASAAASSSRTGTSSTDSTDPPGKSGIRHTIHAIGNDALAGKTDAWKPKHPCRPCYGVCRNFRRPPMSRTVWNSSSNGCATAISVPNRRFVRRARR